MKIKDPIEKLKVFLTNLNIQPNNIYIYERAFTHVSYENENPKHPSYERMEFLGDAIIYHLVSQYLYEQNYPVLNEGRMADERAKLIQKQTLVRAALALKLEQHLFLGRSLINQPVSENILEDVFEAFIAAIYLDQGEEAAWELLNRTIFPYYQNPGLIDVIDYKTIVKEHFEKLDHMQPIIYQTVSEPDNAHSNFYVKLVFNNRTYGSGTGASLKAAQKAAAKDVCNKLNLTIKR